MRFVPANCLKSGQILASSLVFDKNRVLLPQGAALTQTQIERIRALGFQGVYIDDDIGGNISVEAILSDALRDRAQLEIRSLFLAAERAQHAKATAQLDALGSLADGMAEEIRRNRDVMVNRMDIRAYDDYLYSHSVHVAILGCVLGVALGLDRRMLQELALGALIHDIGKVFIDKRILHKDSKLSLEEFEEVKRHSLAGYNYVSSSKSIPARSKMAVLSHHEQYCGAGYPSGLSGNDISLFGRILSVADVYDALVSDRPYRRALQPSDAMEYVMSGYNTVFDPIVVDAFVRKVAPYPVGACVRLNNDLTGVVVENFENACLRPKVRLLKNGAPTEEYIDLAHDYNALSLNIMKIVNF